MGSAVLPGDPPVEVTMRRSARARRLSLRVSTLDGKVTLSVPHGVDEAEAMAFAEEKADWIREHLAQRELPIAVGIGKSIRFRGEMVPIVSAPVRTAEFSDGAIRVPPSEVMAAARVEAFFKITAQQEVSEASLRHAAKINCKVRKITVRDTRSRWGSCSAYGNLMFSWRLIMAPPEVLDYVAAHEVAHLAEMNHAPEFWDLVEKLVPGCEASKLWLRRNGAELHRYRFDDVSAAGL